VLAAEDVEEAGRAEAGRLVRSASLDTLGGTRRLRVSLDDAELGRVTVGLLERRGVVETVVRAESGTAARLIGGGLPALIEALSRQGLAASLVASGSPRDESAQEGGGRSARQGRHAAGRWRRDGRAASAVFRIEGRE
jgi:flagellar hook-length control protein FliK